MADRFAIFRSSATITLTRDCARRDVLRVDSDRVPNEPVFPGRVLDAKPCEMTITDRDQPAPKTPVTIEELAICPGQELAWDFPCTEEARGSNPLTSTRESPYEIWAFCGLA